MTPAQSSAFTAMSATLLQPAPPALLVSPAFSAILVILVILEPTATSASSAITLSTERVLLVQSSALIAMLAQTG